MPGNKRRLSDAAEEEPSAPNKRTHGDSLLADSTHAAIVFEHAWQVTVAAIDEYSSLSPEAQVQATPRLVEVIVNAMKEIEITQRSWEFDIFYSKLMVTTIQTIDKIVVHFLVTIGPAHHLRMFEQVCHSASIAFGGLFSWEWRPVIDVIFNLVDDGTLIKKLLQRIEHPDDISYDPGVISEIWAQTIGTTEDLSRVCMDMDL
ncbi:hypothetical protein QBC40DRAFT_251283 [Triangularia verruculosa]|uniref:Uncharacterized protein n=1 Tax=Triangularia verruculosa TaxID=2587418 RepID=A0AAN6XME5_9PEZI|nr:hypothetical protein QBC40DRAFT_251283 [Triangularia verruculosa]